MVSLPFIRRLVSCFDKSAGGYLAGQFSDSSVCLVACSLDPPSSISFSSLSSFRSVVKSPCTEVSLVSQMNGQLTIVHSGTPNNLLVANISPCSGHEGSEGPVAV